MNLRLEYQVRRTGASGSLSRLIADEVSAQIIGRHSVGGD